MSGSFFCYSTTAKTGDEYFVYWQADSSILGITNMSDNVFEMTLDRQNRKKLLKNVAESLVENKWRSVFANKGLKLRNVQDNFIELFYIVECVTVPRIYNITMCQSRNAALLKNALNEISLLSDCIKSPSNGLLPKSTLSTNLLPSPTHLVNPNDLLTKAQKTINTKRIGFKRRKGGDATVHDEQLPHSTWKLGKIEKLILSHNQAIRFATHGKRMLIKMTS